MTAPLERFRLLPNDLSSSLWLRLREHLKARLDELHKLLEKDQSEMETARLRGTIKCYRELLNLEAMPPIQIDGKRPDVNRSPGYSGELV